MIRKLFFGILMFMASSAMAQGVIDVHSHIITPGFASALEGEGEPQVQPSSSMMVRIAEIEVYSEFLTEYLEFANEVDRVSMEKEPGVLCLFPMQSEENPSQIRILEIYASENAYQQHLNTSHFLKYKQGTLHMVKSLNLAPMRPLDLETMQQIFIKLKR